MKKSSLFLLTLVLLLTFAGCNQKEKKLQNIIDGITVEQKYSILEIASMGFANPDSCHLDIDQRNNTIIFHIVENRLSNDDSDESTVKHKDLEKKFEQLAKNFILSALSSDSPEIKGLLKQIADVPASISIDGIFISETELQDALNKEFTAREILSNWVNCLDVIGEEENFATKLDGDYIVLSYNEDDIISDIDEWVNSDIEHAMNSFITDIDDIVDMDLYKDKISDKYRKDIADDIKQNFDGLFESAYIPKLMKKAATGLIIRFIDQDSDRTLDITFEPDELLILQ